MKGIDHRREAERLIAEGERVAARIAAVHEDPLTMDEVRARRDDLGKKAMGIWAQAQVHATLALASVTALVESSRSANAPTMRPAIDHINEWVEAEQ